MSKKMSEHSINSLLSMEKAMRTRVNQLKSLEDSSTRRTMFFREDRSQEKVEEPTYDIKVVDKKIVKLNNALWEIDQKIKESNARTKIEVNVDFNDLMSEID